MSLDFTRNTTWTGGSRERVNEWNITKKKHQDQDSGSTNPTGFFVSDGPG